MLPRVNKFPPATDVEDIDNERREMYEADVAGLFRFYSKHLELPDHKDLLTLFSQVLHTHTHSLSKCTFLLFLSSVNKESVIQMSFQ